VKVRHASDDDAPVGAGLSGAEQMLRTQARLARAGTTTTTTTTGVHGTTMTTVQQSPPRLEVALGADEPAPVTGAWREGEDPGERRFADVGHVVLEAGGFLPNVRLAYESWGRLSADRDNAVLVLHALTGDSHVVGPAGQGHPTAGWWEGLIGPGLPLDTDRWFVVAPNVLGGCQGTTGPSSAAPDGRPWGSRFPFVTVRDQVAVEAMLADAIGIPKWGLVLGGSMGGMRALEWAVTYPHRVERLLVIASGPYATGDQIAWCAPQLVAVRSDPGFAGGDYYDRAPGTGPHIGLGVARRIAHTTYRAGTEINSRFGRAFQSGENPLGGEGRFAVESYLDYHADKLVRRFDAGSYVVLTEAMNSHDVGRGRGGVANALRRVTAATIVVAVDSDRLYPPDLNREIADAVPGDVPLDLIHSEYGHDGFLVETETVGGIVKDLLTRKAMVTC